MARNHSETDSRKIPVDNGDLTVKWSISGPATIVLKPFVALADMMMEQLRNFNQLSLFKDVPADATVLEGCVLVSDKPKAKDKSLSARIELPIKGSAGKAIASAVYNLSQYEGRTFRVIIQPEPEKKAEKKDDAKAPPKNKDTKRSDPILKLAAKVEAGELCAVGLAAKLEKAGIENVRQVWEAGVEALVKDAGLVRDAAEEVYRAAAEKIDEIEAAASPKKKTTPKE
jgi:hypothetical protein